MAIENVGNENERMKINRKISNVHISFFVHTATLHKYHHKSLFIFIGYKAFVKRVNGWIVINVAFVYIAYFHK